MQAPRKAQFLKGECIMTLKELKQGEYFTLRPIAEPKESQVYIRGEYDRSARRYDCQKWSDINYSRLLPGKTVVYTDFCF